MIRPPLRLAAALLAAACACAATAESDVDQADSLRFNQFFKDKKDAVKVWKDADGTLETGQRQDLVKVYEQAPAAAAAPAATAGPATDAAGAGGDDTGKRYEIRERYTLSRSAKTPYSAFYVIEALHQQMAELCPAGWRKLSERSEPVETDYYLYYELECL